jgi:hypothetical protein
MKDLEQFGVCADRIKAGAWEELGNNPMLQRHIEPHHIILSRPDAADMCPCCTTVANPNKSLIKIDQEVADYFRGSVLALGAHCDADTEKKLAHLDLKPVDLRHVVDNLRMVYCKFEDINRRLMEGSEIKAVRLNCEGDTFFCDRAEFQPVLEPKSALLLASDIPTPVADRIGIPIIVRKVPPAIVWRDARRPYRINNDNTRMLNPPVQGADTGSLVLLRKDGKPLLPIHIHALFGYTAQTLLNPIYPQNGCITTEMLLASRIDQVSKEGFEACYKTMWQKWPLKCPFVPSPFDIPDDYDGGESGFNARHE